MEAVLGLARAALAIPALMEALEWLEAQFDDPTCSDLLEDIGMSPDATTSVQQQDASLNVNSEGVYTSVS
jgi:hypothetical protein